MWWAVCGTGWVGRGGTALELCATTAPPHPLTHHAHLPDWIGRLTGLTSLILRGRPHADGPAAPPFFPLHLLALTRLAALEVSAPAGTAPAALALPPVLGELPSLARLALTGVRPAFHAAAFQRGSYGASRLANLQARGEVGARRGVWGQGRVGAVPGLWVGCGPGLGVTKVWSGRATPPSPPTPTSWPSP